MASKLSIPHFMHKDIFGYKNKSPSAKRRQNAELTTIVKDLSERIEALTVELHRSVVHGGKDLPKFFGSASYGRIGRNPMSHS